MILIVVVAVMVLVGVAIVLSLMMTISRSIKSQLKHGKGFTVVAQEVKNLAEQSKHAVMEQISDAITHIDKAGSQSASGTQGVEREIEELQQLAVRSRRLVEARAVAAGTQPAVALAT